MQKWEYCWIRSHAKQDEDNDVIGGIFELNIGNDVILLDYVNDSISEKYIIQKEIEFHQKLPRFDTKTIFFKGNNNYQITNLTREILKYLGNLGWEMSGVGLTYTFFKRPID
jgi:hypothetical protein